jgi:sugar phosphate isomerase/epimerase
MPQDQTRRTFLKSAGRAVAAVCVVDPASLMSGLHHFGIPTTGPARAQPATLGAARSGSGVTDPLFRISLAEWSLHRALESGGLDHLDFPRAAKRDYGIEAVEYVSTFFSDPSGRQRPTGPSPADGRYFRGSAAADRRYLRDLKGRCDGEDVRSLLVMCDGEGALGDPNAAARTRAVENHRKWVEAARYLGCHSIRVNAQSQGTPEEQRDLAADGLRRLTELAAPRGIDVIVENHGGISSNGAWLASVIRAVAHPRCGTLPDFGNFQVREGEWYDRYQGVGEMMPFARAVSAKSHDFDAAGNERSTDYERMLRVVLGAGYRGHVGVEYEGDRLSEPEGIRATKALLERLRDRLAGEYR